MASTKVAREFLGINARSSGNYRTEKLNGTEYIVVPVVALVEGVLQGITADQPELALAEEFGRFPMAWNGRPITIDHPYVQEGEEIIRVSASASPDVLEDFQVGFIFNTKLDGTKLKMEAWIDPVKANTHSDAARNLLSKIRKGEMIEVSTGLFTGSEVASGTYEDREYFGVWRGVVPDHLALLPEGLIGACSNADGCGVYANQKEMRVHKLKTQAGCECGPSAQSGSSAKPIVVNELAFNPDEFLANMLPDGMLDSDVRTLLQNQIADTYPGSYAYLIGFTAKKAVFSMYDTINGDRENWQISYNLDADSKEVSFSDDLECVALTTEITVMPDTGDYNTPKSPKDLASTKQTKKVKKVRTRNILSSTGEPSDDDDDDDNAGAAAASSAAASEVAGFSAGTTTENPMKTNTGTAAPVTPVAVTAESARTFLVNFGHTADVLKAMKDEDVLKIHAGVAAAIEGIKADAKKADKMDDDDDDADTKGKKKDDGTKAYAAPTAAEYLASAPAEIRESLEAGMNMLQRHKATLVDRISANSRNKFSKEQLSAMDTKMLESIAELAIVPDYSGVAAPGGGIHANTQITVNEADSPYAAAPPRLGLNRAIDEPRGVMKKDAA